MGMPAKDAVYPVMFRIGQRTRGDFGCEPQPCAIHAVEKAAELTGARIQPLQHQISPSAQPAQHSIVDNKAVELMSMYGQVAFSLELPEILLIHTHAHQVCHEMRESMVVIAFHPHHFNVALA